jgi:hypothetical protein
MPWRLQRRVKAEAKFRLGRRDSQIATTMKLATNTSQKTLLSIRPQGIIIATPCIETLILIPDRRFLPYFGYQRCHL